MNIRPLFDRVLISPETDDLSTKSGLVLPATSGDRPERGKVVAVGDGEDFDGNKKEMKVSVGENVLFNKYAGTEVKIDGKSYLIMREIDIIGVIE